MFPEKYPNSDSIQRERVRLASIRRKKEVKEEDLNIQFKFKELLKHIADLLRRVPFLCVTLAASLQALVVSIIVSFAPKYVETQFVTGPAKTGHICTNYTYSENSTFLGLWVRYLSSVNFFAFILIYK